MASRDQDGYSLIGLLAYIAIFAMVFNVMTSLFTTNTRVTALNTLAMERSSGVTEIEHSFTKAVREGYGVVEGIGTHRSGGNVAVLALPPFEGHSRYAVIGAVARENQFGVLKVLDRGGELEALSFKTHRLPVDGLLITEEDGLLRLEFRIQRDPEERKVEATLHRVVAAPRARMAVGGQTK